MQHHHRKMQLVEPGDGNRHFGLVEHDHSGICIKLILEQPHKTMTMMMPSHPVGKTSNNESSIQSLKDHTCSYGRSITGSDKTNTSSSNVIDKSLGKQY